VIDTSPVVELTVTVSVWLLYKSVMTRSDESSGLP
jgi:hypothetical protein